MSENDESELNEILNNIVSIDEGRIKRLVDKGHYISLLERFDVLRIKFVYDDLQRDEAIKFITLCKYFIKHGHTESLRLSCSYMYKKYMKSQGL